jgi:DNA-binding transcriptional LysR family regulator
LRPSPLIVDDVEIMIRAAIDGVGLAFVSEEHAAPHLASRALGRVLEGIFVLPEPAPAATGALGAH